MSFCSFRRAFLRACDPLIAVASGRALSLRCHEQQAGGGKYKNFSKDSKVDSRLEVSPVPPQEFTQYNTVPGVG